MARPVDQERALDRGEAALRMLGVGRDECGQVCAGAVTQQQDMIGIVAEVSSLAAQSGERPADVSSLLLERGQGPGRRTCPWSCGRRADEHPLCRIGDRGLVGHTVEAFQDAGLSFYNEAILLDPVGTVRLRAGNLFTRTRKLSRLHQHLLVFVKGDHKRAAQRVSLDFGAEVSA